MKQWILGKLWSEAPYLMNVTWTLRWNAVQCTNLSIRALTDVVVLVSGTELEAEWEWCKELEFFWEAERPVWVLRPVTFPAFKPPHAVFTGGVAVMVNHKEDIALHPARRLRLLVVRTVHVQIVIDVYGYRVLSMPKPVKRIRKVSDILNHRSVYYNMRGGAASSTATWRNTTLIPTSIVKYK